MRTFRAMPIALVLAACTMFAACASAPKPQPVNVKLNIVVSADVNPDAQNRPSPIVVRIYQLKDDAAFKDADFFALYDKEEATLAASLGSRAEYELAPGESRSVDYSVSPDTRFIGVIAAYRNIRDAQWRALSGPADKGAFDVVKNGKLGLAVDRARVRFAASK
ncbi:MAG TPA: type VI secretion system lipoprotein TssJ [Steroidobacteraceae bacterium]|nr:type VI secretion system lipoprotein TssJ [Steroidobacteraceae bacterium]